MLITAMLILAALVAYFLGSVNGAILISRYLFHSDVRSMGSGNAGLTNFYRSFGPRGMAGVVLIDVAKGALAALVSGWLLAIAAPAVATPTAQDLAPFFTDTGRAFGAFCVVLGHSFPAFHEFRGGKGILCGVAAVFVVDWRAGFICLLVFGVAFGLTRYVSLGSILGALSFPVSLVAFGYTGLPLILALLAVALVVLRHAANIVRLLRGREAKLELKRDVTHKLDEDDF